MSILLLQRAIAIAQDWQWSKHFGGPGHDVCYVAGVDGSGNVYCYGNYADPGPGTYSGLFIETDTLHGSRDGLLAKFNGSGDLIWSLDCASPNGIFRVNSVVLDTANSQLFVVGGHTASGSIGSTTLPDSGAYLASVDLSGTCLWAENIGTPGTVCHGVAMDSAGFIYLAGTTDPLLPAIFDTDTIDPGSFIAKYTQDGTLVWVKELITGTSATGEPRFFPYQLHPLGGVMLVHGPAAQFSGSGAFEADTVESEVVVGGGHALLALDTTTGVCSWMRTIGFANQPQDRITRQRMSVSPDGKISCIATVFGDSARFDPDTALIASGSSGLAYLVVYNADGQMTLLRNYGTHVALQAIDSPTDSSLLLLLVFNGSGSVDACSGSSGLLMIRLDTLGDCSAMIEVASAAYGTHVLQTSNDIFIIGTTPDLPQFMTTSFADSTYTSYGFEDALLAKHDLALSTGILHSMLNTALVIYANPNEGSFRLIIPSEFANERLLQLSVYDASGRLVTEGPLDMGEEHPRTDLYNIAPGNYEVSLTNGKRTYHGSMVVQ